MACANGLSDRLSLPSPRVAARRDNGPTALVRRRVRRNKGAVELARGRGGQAFDGPQRMLGRDQLLDIDIDENIELAIGVLSNTGLFARRGKSAF